MPPNSIGGKQRHIGNIAHAVARYSNQRLPRWLRPPGTRSTHDARSAMAFPSRSRSALRCPQAVVMKSASPVLLLQKPLDP